MRVELRAKGRSVVTSALVNTGYEAAEPEIHVPAKLAANLGLSVEGAPTEKYGVVGAEVDASAVGEVDVRVIAGDKVTRWVRAKAVSVAGEGEVIISDRLCEELGIEPVRAWSGLWRLSGEAELRESAAPEYWY